MKHRVPKCHEYTLLLYIYTMTELNKSCGRERPRSYDSLEENQRQKFSCFTEAKQR